MNPSPLATPCWAPGSTAAHASFSDLCLHLEDTANPFDEMLRGTPQPPEPRAASSFHPPVKAKVLFQFFDGLPMAES